MSVAWATIIIIALLLPGAAFLFGFSTKDKFSREILKSGVLGEIALALFISTILHTTAYYFVFDANGASTLRSGLFAYEQPSVHSKEIEGHLFYFSIYTILVSLAAYSIGYLIALLVRRGCLPNLARYPWTITLMDRTDAIITASVVTKSTANSYILMYTGLLNDFFIDENGLISYIILEDCRRAARPSANFRN